jgi:hypothetical protein
MKNKIGQKLEKIGKHAKGLAIHLQKNHVHTISKSKHGANESMRHNKKTNRGLKP